MSLLLDALKKAAEAKSRGQNESNQTSPEESAQADAGVSDTQTADPPQVTPSEQSASAAPDSGRQEYDPDASADPLDDSLEDAFDHTQGDATGQRFSQYDEFDETQQLDGEGNERDVEGGYGTPRHAETVFASKSVHRPLRRGIGFGKILVSILLIAVCAGASYYYVQERDYDFQRQLTNIRTRAPIVPLKSPEEIALEQSKVADVERAQSNTETDNVQTGVPESSSQTSAEDTQTVISEIPDSQAPSIVDEDAVASSNQTVSADIGIGDADASSEPVADSGFDDAVAELSGQELQAEPASETSSVESQSVEESVPTQQAESDLTEESAQDDSESSTAQNGQTESEKAPVADNKEITESTETDDAAVSTATPVEQQDESEAALSIARASRELEADVLVRDAYAAYQAKQFDKAESLYRQALQLSPRHRDAMLGSAAVYLQRGQSRAALAIYRELLSVNPRDHAALAGMNAFAQDDNLQRYESDLRFLLRETPDSAPLNYALGTLLSRQKRWADAQQHFFNAFTGDPQNPDIAFNLAVSLDNLGKSAPAAQYYQTALDLARDRAASFDSVQVFRRLQTLEQ
ncbi:MAG: tetratricopeptide repeat protein [Pseudomonadota bacterium]